MPDFDPKPQIMEATGHHTATMILLHGLTGTTQQMMPAARGLSQQFPHIRFILPQAPLRQIGANWGCKKPAWFDFYSFTPRAEEPYFGPTDPNEQQISESIESIEQLVRDETERGIRPERIVILGFSQGAVISLLAALSHPDRIGGVAVLSAFLERSHRLETFHQEHAKEMPIFFAHGMDDPIVPYDWATKSVERLRMAGYKRVEFRSYPVLGHAFGDEERIHLLQWVASTLPA